MKRNLTLLSYLIIAVAFVFTSCKGDDDPTPEEQKIKELSATWTLTEANPTGFDAVTLTGVTITFETNGTYSISGLTALDASNLNNEGAFKASGEFTLSGDNFELLSLGTSTEFTIRSVNQQTGAISLAYNATYPKSTSESISITINGEL